MIQWRKSERSGENGNCVELAEFGGGIAFRDSKSPQAAILVPRRDAATLIRSVKAGKWG